MRLTLEPTDEIVFLDENLEEHDAAKVHTMRARVWKGSDENGVPVIAWIAALSPQTQDPEINARFASELEKLPGVVHIARFERP